MAQEPQYTYILRCSDGTLYTGWTNHLDRRVREHEAGVGAKYTRSRRPVELVYYEIWSTKSEALRRENEIKHLKRRAKLALIGTGEPDEQGIPCRLHRDEAPEGDRGEGKDSF